jgi:lactoylglutathione lyase
MIKALKTQAVYVTNQNAALAFYKDILGFEVRRWEPLGVAGSWIEVAPPGADTCIVLYPRDLMADWAQRCPSIVFKCDDVATTHAELEAKGVTFSQEPTKMGWGNFASFLDPDGNEFGLSDAPDRQAPPQRARTGSMPPPPPPPR